jgi:hypothetical protein
MIGVILARIPTSSTDVVIPMPIFARSWAIIAKNPIATTPTETDACAFNDLRIPTRSTTTKPLAVTTAIVPNNSTTTPSSLPSRTLRQVRPSETPPSSPSDQPTLSPSTQQSRGPSASPSTIPSSDPSKGPHESPKLRPLFRTIVGAK